MTHTTLTIIETLTSLLIKAGIAVAGIAVLTYFIITIGGENWTRWRKKNTKEHWGLLNSLLANRQIIHTYTPSQMYVEDLETLLEGETPSKKKLHHAWISPYRRAVKASIKRHGRTPRGQHFNARRQVRDASERITVRELNEWELQENGGTQEDQFIVELALDGNEHDRIEALAGNIKAQLGVETVERLQNQNFHAITFLCKWTDSDPLEDLKPDTIFLEAHPAKHWNRLPIGMKINGQPWNLNLHHTIGLGITGSGKGSIIHAIIKQLNPYHEKKLVRYYGIDPKGTELKPYATTNYFEEVAINPQEQPQLIDTIYRELMKRTQGIKPDIEKAELGRDFKLSKNNPITILFIDEFLSVLQDWQGQGRDGKILFSQLTQVLAQGRSVGIFVIALTQSIEQALLGNMRANFANSIVLSQPSVYMNDFLLGANAAADGYDSTAIAPSNRANNYRTAGIAFAKDEGGDPVKMRIAYSTDEDISELLKKFRGGNGKKGNSGDGSDPTPDDSGDGNAPDFNEEMSRIFEGAEDEDWRYEEHEAREQGTAFTNRKFNEEMNRVFQAENQRRAEQGDPHQSQREIE